jgi:DNA-binding beta-propeller fold protein YncE
MTAILGSGENRYRVVENWAKLPEGWELKDVASVAVDSRDRVYVFNRGEHPMIVFDADGNFFSSWGEGTFPRAHGLHIDANDCLYCTDDGGHFVRKCTTDGKVLLEIGVPGKETPYMSGLPFHRCTHTALSPKGEIYVSDGYGNSCVHKYSPDGKHLMCWGTTGTDPGEFNIAHNIAADEDGWVYVADRENHRVQIFDDRGQYVGQWNNLHRPCGLFASRAHGQRFFVGELPTALPVNAAVANVGARVSVLSLEGKLLDRVGAPFAGEKPGEFTAPHGVVVDSRGDLYVAEVSYTAKGATETPPRELQSFQKFALV